MLLLGGLALTLAALAFRVWGIGWSLPYVDHPDEPAVLDVILRIVEGQANPDFFFYPSLMFYLHALLLKLHFWWGLQSGLYSAPLSLPDSSHFYTTIPGAFVWSRGLTALLGAATVAALALWGSRYVGRAAVLVGALLLALSPWAITHSHYLTVDIPAVFGASLAVLAVLAVLRRGTRRDYLLAGLLIGLATAMKYQNVLLGLSLVLAHAARWRRRSVARGGLLIGAGLLAALFFLLTSPYILLDFAAFQRDIQRLFSSYEVARGDVWHAWPVLEYLQFLFWEGLRPLPALLSLVGGVVLFRRQPALTAVLLTYPLLLAIVLLRSETHFFRNLLPVQPPLLLLAGVGAVRLWELARRLIPARVSYAGAGALLLLISPSLAAAVAVSAEFARPDSRVAAQEWARREWPGTRIASEVSHPLRWDDVSQSSHIHYLPLYPPEWYRRQGYGLLLASSHTRRSQEWTADYNALLEQGTVVAGFGGPGSGYRGPRVDLLATGLTSATMPVSAPQGELGPLQLRGVDIGRLVEHDIGPERQPGRDLHAGDVLAITAYWTLDQPAPPGNYVTFVHLRDQQGRNLVQRDVPPWFGLFPLESWPPGKLVVESLDLWLPHNLPPGEYSLVLGLYDNVSQARYAASAGDLPLSNDEVPLGSVRVLP